MSPNRPPMAVSAKKAITVVSVAEKTGGNIRRAAFSEAVTASSPLCRARKSACSPTTMASSTTIPSVMISANSEIMLNVSPKAYITEIAVSIETGMPTATQKAVRALRNRNSSITTSPSPIAPFSRSRSSRPVMSSALVRTSSISTPSGRVRSISSATSSTIPCIRTASPCAERLTLIDTARSSPTK